MPRTHVSTTAVLKASPGVVYAILADYRDGHPYILPRIFQNLVVEQGGIGHGTLITYQVRILGATRTARARITEAEPGKILAETDQVTGAVTTFTVEPAGDDARVTITTEWNTPGLRGWIESRIAPPMLRKIYEEELINLGRLAAERSRPHAPHGSGASIQRS